LTFSAGVATLLPVGKPHHTAHVKFSLRKYRKFRASLGPVEQAQVVASTAVVVAMVTIVMVRVFSGYQLDWYDFVSVTTVGVFGFLIVFFTLRYGRQLEEQKQELLSLKTLAEAINRAVEIGFLLQSAVREVKSLLDVEYGWMYHVEGGRLVLRASQTDGEQELFVIEPNADATDPSLDWIRTPRIERKPKRRRRDDASWPYGAINAWASVPIVMKDTFEGVIVLASHEREAFGKKQLDLMGAFANQVGVALENVALFERLRKSEERYMDLFEHSPDMYHIVNSEGLIVSCNQTEAQRLGYRKEELVGESILMLYPSVYHQDERRLLRTAFENNQEIKGLEEQMVTKGGELIDVSINTSIIVDEGGTPVLMRVVARDITEKKQLEEKILHAQRIDSIGNLAGGVAHDFNNILTSILGSTALMKRKLRRTDAWGQFVDIIETAAKRGASLTRQLLTFARKSNVQFRPVIVNYILSETIQLFERSIDKTIAVRNMFSEEPCIVNGDEGQIQQAVLNLLINARDAIQEEGSITVRGGVVDFDSQTFRNVKETKSGKYVAITVADTGQGMDRKVQQRIFEPFFTTKEQGKGTGLGLSVVYGVVNGHNGFIALQSEPGKGTEFSLYFPLFTDVQGLPATRKRKRLRRGKEKVLVVDDEKPVTDVIGGMLKDLGYNVTVVNSGRRAFTLFKKRKQFDLVVLDINMPTIGGKETLQKLREIDPNVRIIISTGYGTKSMESLPLREAVDGFLEKPYQIEELSEMLRTVLDK
jgi:PAS domain S-box-containing protein